jgi:type II secretion system protein N
VQKFSRAALFLLGGMSIVSAVLLLGVNLYVQSQGTQARIQQELRQRLGTTLNIQRTSVTPWGGLKLSGITIPHLSPTGSSNFLEAKSFGLRIGFLSLFSQHLVIKEVSLTDPKVIWPQNADGKWRLPSSTEKKQTPELAALAALAAESPSGEPHVEAETPTPGFTRAEPRKHPSIPRPVNATRGFVPEIRRINVTGGEFRFLDRSGNMVATFEGVGFRSNVRNAVSLRGSAHVAKISLRDRFFLEQFKSALQYDPTSLELSQISAHAGGGDIMGRFSMQPETEDSPFAVDVKFRNLQADRIVMEAGGPSGVVEGKLEGSLEASGKTADSTALTGTGEVFLRDGEVKQYNLLVALGQIFQIEELTQLHLEQAQAKYHISPGVVTIDELILRSPNIHLSATGTVSFSGKLHLASRLAINEKIRSQLFKPIRSNFQPTDEPGYSALDFEVGGTLERPKTNLLEKVVGRDLRDLVNGLWGGKGERPKKKKPAGTPLAEPIASPSPLSTPEATKPETAATPAPSP